MNRESHETHREGPLVPGEYNVVVRASRDVDGLMLAHSTPLTREQAKVLVWQIQQAFDLPAHRVMYSARSGRFSYGAKQRLETRLDSMGNSVISYRTGKPRKWRRLVRDAQGDIVYEARVSLPNKPRAAATANNTNCFAGLRVGVVLHEYAHLLDWHARGRTDHSPAFTHQLDRLVAWWQERALFLSVA